MSEESKFVYHRLWAERRNGNNLNIEDLVDQCDLFKGQNSDIIVERKSNYYHEFSQYEDNLFYGRIIQTQRDEEYFRTTSDGDTRKLSDFMQEDGETGQIEFDITRVAVLIDEYQVYLLIEKGYQTPGVGVVGDFIRKVIDRCLNDFEDEFRVKSKWMVDQDNVDRLEELLEEEISSTEIRFKELPEITDEDGPEEGLERMTPEDYTIRVEYSIKGGNNRERVTLRSALNKLLGIDEGNMMETMRQIEFPRLMSMFKVTPFDEDAIEEENENLAKATKMEIIEIETGFNSYGEVGETLCEKLKNEISNNDEDS